MPLAHLLPLAVVLRVPVVVRDWSGRGPDWQPERREEGTMTLPKKEGRIEYVGQRGGDA